MDKTWKLPHPVRLQSIEKYAADTEGMDKAFDQVISDLDISKLNSETLGNIVNDAIPELTLHQRQSGLTKHEIKTYLESITIPYRYRKNNGTILTTSNVLDKLLENTEIGTDIPVSYLRPPFKDCFIEFTEDRSSNLCLYNKESGEHILEGVYLSETKVSHTDNKKFISVLPEIDINDEEDSYILDMMFVGSPIGKSHAMDDTLRVQSFRLQGEKITITDYLQFIEKEYGKDDDFSDDLPYLSKALEHMAKVLLFLNCKQYRDTAFNERKEIEKKIQSLKSSKKISKYTKKLKTAYNRVVIKPKDDIAYTSKDSNDHPTETTQKKAHWRKGHIRMQPYGEGSLKRKIIFISPRIVGGVFAKKKEYSATTKSTPNELPTE